MQTMGFLSSENNTDTSKVCDAIVPEHFTHAHAVGQTGCGKTSSFIYPNLLSRIRSGHSILLYDFKGKEHMSLKYLAHQEGRLEDVVEIGKPWGAKTNLMRLMDRKALDMFIKTTIGYSRENQYWASSASKLFLSVYDVIVLLEKISDCASKLDFQKEFKKALEMPDTMDLEKFNYPSTLSFKSIMPICQSEQEVSSFVNHLDRLERHLRDFYLKVLEDDYENGIDLENTQKHKSFIHLFVQLRHVLETSKVSLSSFKKVDETNPKLSIIMSLLPLVDVANKDEFNTDDVDVLEALNDKKLVSINAKDLSDELLEAITYALFNEFSKRSMMMKVQPISVFIDEAQRVISKNQDHSLDVLRECRVEMFLAYQNEELMQNKLGNNEYSALMKNLSTSFHFTNLAYHQENDLSALNTFECISSKDDYKKTHTLEPLFIDKYALYQTEAIYLKRQGVFKAFGLERFEKDSILLLDGRLFEANQVIVYNMHTDCSSIEEIISPEDMNAIHKEMRGFTFLLDEEKTRQLRMLEEEYYSNGGLFSCEDEEDEEYYEEEPEDYVA